MPENNLPLPIIDTDTRPFWESCKKHDMAIQKCADCGSVRFPPHPLCPKCLSANATWVKVSGKGRVYTYVTYVQAPRALSGTQMPFTVSMIELPEGFRMWTNVVDRKPDQIYIGMPVELVYEDINEEVTLPKFKCAESSTEAS
jgi:uncharacterized OB-fold protein